MAFKMKGFPFPGKSPLKVDQQLIDAATEAAMANVPDTEAQQRINARIMSARGQGLQALGEGIGGGAQAIGQEIGSALTPSKDEDDDKDKKSPKKKRKRKK